jgi:hemolysin-activating ACP:hemolysin acyltransferase
MVLPGFEADLSAPRARELQPNDWQSGLRLWLIDFVAPFGKVRPSIRSLILSQQFGIKEVRFIRRHKETGMRRAGMVSMAAWRRKAVS